MNIKGIILLFLSLSGCAKEDMDYMEPESKRRKKDDG